MTQYVKSENPACRGLPIVGRKSLFLDDGLHDMAECAVFLEASPRQHERSRQEIERLKGEIVERGHAHLPPLIIAEEDGQVQVLDGNHRVLALWESGITHHPAVIVEKNI